MVLDIRLATGFRTMPLGIPGSRGIMLGWSIQGDKPIDAALGAEVSVAGDEDALERGERLLWRAQGVPGGVVRYGGQGLVSRQHAVWRVAVRTMDGEVAVSLPTAFEIGLEPEADWTARWVSAPLLLRRDPWDPVPLLRGAFDLDRVPEDQWLHPRSAELVH